MSHNVSSHHRSELTACGLTIETLNHLEKLGFEKETVYASFLFLYSGGRYNTVSELMQLRNHNRGVRSCKEKIPQFFESMRDLLLSMISWYEEIIGNDHNTTQGIMDPDPRIVFDTVPIFVDAWSKCYQPKYANYVAKVFVAISLTGYVVHAGKTLYTGASADSFTQDDVKIDEYLKKYNLHALGDGGFCKTANIATPFDKTHLEAPHVKKSFNAPAEVQKMLDYNERLAHFRARSEHIFGRGCMGRWLAFKNWTHNPKLLWHVL